MQPVAPIALYPEPMLSKMLMAATYPAEAVEADSCGRIQPIQPQATPGWNGPLTDCRYPLRAAKLGS